MDAYPINAAQRRLALERVMAIVMNPESPTALVLAAMRVIAELDRINLEARRLELEEQRSRRDQAAASNLRRSDPSLS